MHESNESILDEFSDLLELGEKLRASGCYDVRIQTRVQGKLTRSVIVCNYDDELTVEVDHGYGAFYTIIVGNGHVPASPRTHEMVLDEVREAVLSRYQSQLYTLDQQKRGVEYTIKRIKKENKK
jgi:hypothetical protein